MHRDSKTRRNALNEIRERELRQPKHTDPEALKRFREKPYQLQYMEKLKQRRERFAGNIDWQRIRKNR